MFCREENNFYILECCSASMAPIGTVVTEKYVKSITELPEDIKKYIMTMIEEDK